MIDLTKIKHLRKSKGRIQSRCADSIGVSVSEYSRKESGQSPFSLQQLEDLAKYFNVDVSVFYNQEMRDNGKHERDFSLLEAKDMYNEIIETQKKYIRNLEEEVKRLKKNNP
jgi:transcriptional regulator with XRE-family HTH domain